MDYITERIESLRKQRGLTQEQIADELSMSRNNYRRLINRGKKMSLIQIEKIVNILNGDLPSILFGKIRDKECEDENEKLKNEIEIIKLKHENTILNNERTAALFRYYFNRILDNLQIQINSELSKKPLLKEHEIIINESMSNSQKVTELLETGIWEFYGNPEYLNPNTLEKMIKKYVRSNNLVLEKDQQGYWYIKQKD